MLFIHLSFAALIAVLGATLYFIMLFPHHEHSLPRAICIAVPTVLLVALSVLGFFFTVLPQRVPSASAEAVRMIHLRHAYSFFVWYAVVIMVCVFVTLIMKWVATADARARVQFQYVSLGLVIPFIFGMITTVFLPYIHFLVALRSTNVYPFSSFENFGIATTMCLSGATAYGMLRHRLLDVKIVIQRNTISIASALFTVALLLVGIVYANALLQFDIGLPEVLRLLITLCAGALLFVPIQRLTNRLSRVILKEQVLDFHRWTPDELELFQRSTNPHDFARTVAADFYKRLPVKHWTFVVYHHPSRSMKTVFPDDRRANYAIDEGWVLALYGHRQVVSMNNIGELGWTQKQKRDLEKVMRAHQALYVIPFGDAHRLIGVIFVGARMDGKPFTASDTAFLARVRRTVEYLLWNVLQLQHIVYSGVEDGAPLPNFKELDARYGSKTKRVEAEYQSGL